MPEMRLSGGTVEYEDTGGGGPVVVLVHGLVMNGTVWRKVVAELRGDHRCVVPTLPLGAHRLPMRPDCGLSPHRVAELLAEFVERLGAEDVTLVGNDIGLAQMVAAYHPRHIGRLVLTAQEAFDNYPPGLPGKVAELSGRLPGGLLMMSWLLRIRAFRRLPFTFGWMSKRPVPDEVFDGWVRPLRDPAIRRDLGAFMAAVTPDVMLRTAEALPSFDRPALVVWAPEDRMNPREHGRRLAELLPRGRLVEIPDSYMLIPEDQPVRLARHIAEFTGARAATADAP